MTWGFAVLLRRPTLDGIAAGRITCAFRRWDRPRVRPGTRLRTAVGVLAVTAVEPVEPDSLTAHDAAAAGQTLADLGKSLARGSGTVWRVDLHLAGPDPRIALRSAEVDEAARAELDARLARF